MRNRASQTGKREWLIVGNHDLDIAHVILVEMHTVICCNDE